MFQARRKIGLATLISLTAVISFANAQAAGKGNLASITASAKNERYDAPLHAYQNIHSGNP